MTKDNFEESTKELKQEEKFMYFTEKEVEDARKELELLGVDNNKLYDFNTDAKDSILGDDENYHPKSA